jgi:hypothetical protein
MFLLLTSDLSERFDNHHKMPFILRNGVIHIHVHTSGANETVRLAEEKDPVWRWTPLDKGSPLRALAVLAVKTKEGLRAQAPAGWPCGFLKPAVLRSLRASPALRTGLGHDECI